MKIRKVNGVKVYDLTRMEMAKLRVGWDVLDMLLELVETEPEAKTREQLAAIVKIHTEPLDG